jgi:hypothetical protein
MEAAVVVDVSNWAVEDAERETPVAPKWISVVVEFETWLKKEGAAFEVKGKA